MSKSAKSRKNKVPLIGEKEYAAYINFLKSGDVIHSQDREDRDELENLKTTKTDN